MNVEDLKMTDQEILAAAKNIRENGRPNPFAAGSPSPEWCEAVLIKAEDIEKAAKSSITKAPAN